MRPFDRPAGDALSLTLPSVKTRTRRRRRPRPPRGFWWWLAWFVYCVAFAIHDALDGAYRYAALQTYGAVIYWKLAMRARAGLPPFNLWPFIATYFAALGLLIVTGAQ